jgi:hypothetical protein
MRTNVKSPVGPDWFALDDEEGMLPAVEPKPVAPITALEEVAVKLVEPLAVELVVIRSEKRLVEPRVVPRLLAGELAVAVPDVSEDEEVLVAVLVETISVVAAAIEVVLAGLEAFELEFREDTRFPLPLPRSPFNRGAMRAANRSAWMEPARRTVRRNCPTETTAVLAATAVGPPPPVAGDDRSRFQ